MGSNPINLAVRFLLEMFALFALGRWGWMQGTGILRFVLILVLQRDFGRVRKGGKFSQALSTMGKVSCMASTLAIANDVESEFFIKIRFG